LEQRAHNGNNIGSIFATLHFFLYHFLSVIDE
jgi:hypothetical protein